MRSGGRSRIAWLSASISRLVYRRYSSGVGAGEMPSQFSAMAGSSSWSMSPASMIALYSSRIASAHAHSSSSSSS